MTRFYKDAMHKLHTGEGTPAEKIPSTERLEKEWDGKAKKIGNLNPFRR
jgi:hypothetical protein